MASKNEKFYAEVSKEARRRLGITDEDAGVFTENQRKMLLFTAEGYPLWSVESHRKKGAWTYRFDFKHGKVAWLDADEIFGLKRHIDFFTDVGMIGLSPDLLKTVESDVEYDQSEGVGTRRLRRN